LLAGLLLRNTTQRPWVWPRHFGTAGGVLVLLLFVYLGALWSPGLLAAGGVAVQAALIDGTSYVPTGVGLLLFGLGAGIAMPPATDMIMATLPAARAGVGSAVNDTVREIGGALGVAVIGSVAASAYASNVEAQLDGVGGVPQNLRAAVSDNVGAALEVSRHLGADGAEVAAAARQAFIDSMSGSLWVGVGLAALAAAVAFVHLPKRSATQTTHHHGHVDAASSIRTSTLINAQEG